jgi:hypothetical protein
MHDFVRQTELHASLSHFVFKKLPERLDQLEIHFLGQAANVVMTLDERGRIAADRHALNHVGVKCALGEEAIPGVGALVGAILREQFLRRLFKHPNELTADHLAFRFGVGYALEQSEKMLPRHRHI